ncbi:hypothetical protein OHA21_19785 [Actinoplanes sp. NBC_00393]|uniref:hypothetical protein n=1 Tax=Actinoplanes sp. NBC_00393 TaxID=2975953 RepID=UPI002E22242D
MVMDIVFRRLGAADARELSLVYRSPRLSGDEQWSGLWNLTAANGSALTAAAATEQLSARTLEVRALAVRPGQPAPDRLVRELADLCRARGVERLVAAVADGDAVLRRAGFAPSDAAWLAREI